MPATMVSRALRVRQATSAATMPARRRVFSNEIASLPAWLRSGLKYVPPAVLSAIIFPEIFLQNGKLAISLENTRLLAGIVAALVAWRTRNALLTIVAGMAVLFLVQWLR